MKKSQELKTSNSKDLINIRKLCQDYLDNVLNLDRFEKEFKLIFYDEGKAEKNYEENFELVEEIFGYLDLVELDEKERKGNIVLINELEFRNNIASVLKKIKLKLEGEK